MASTSLVEVGKQAEEEDVDLDSSLIWAIRYLETEAVEEMLSEGACCPSAFARAQRPWWAQGGSWRVELAGSAAANAATPRLGRA